MHEIERTDAFTLVGVDAREGKLTLFDAPGPRDVGALVRVVLPCRRPRPAPRTGCRRIWRPPGRRRRGARRPRRAGARARRAPGCELDYDLDHVELRVSDIDAAAMALAELGFEREGDRLVVGDASSACSTGARPRASGRCSTTWRCWSTRPRRSRPRPASAAPTSRRSRTPRTRSRCSSGARTASRSSTSSTSRASAGLEWRISSSPAPAWPACAPRPRRVRAAPTSCCSRRPAAPGGSMLLSSGSSGATRSGATSAPSAPAATRRCSGWCGTGSTRGSNGSSRSAHR